MVLNPQTFKQPWFSPIAARNTGVYTPLKQNHFIFQIGGRGDILGNCATGFSMIDGRPDSACPQTDAYDTENHGIIWYAKNVTKPSISFLKSDSDLLDGIEVAPSAVKISRNSVSFSPLSLTLIDPNYPNATRRLLRILRRSGLYDKSITPIATEQVDSNGNPASSAPLGQFQSALHTIILGNARLYQYTSDPGSKNGSLMVSEAWTFYGCHLFKIDFGKLDYSSNDFVELNVEIGYNTFDVETPTLAGEIEFKYGKDAKEISRLAVDPPDKTLPVKTGGGGGGTPSNPLIPAPT